MVKCEIVDTGTLVDVGTLSFLLFGIKINIFMALHA
jgi:hypothetical protein